MTAIPLEKEAAHYPDSDGEPMAETELHLQEMVYAWEALNAHFQGDPDVFVGANMFLYYREGDPSGVVAPDAFVVKGVPKLPGGRERRTYLLWNEGQAPCFVLETTSASTHEQDVKKKRIYEQLGVAEYFQFDPLGEYLRPPLQGYRLVNGRYQRLHPGPDGSLLSQSTGVLFRPDGRRLRLAVGGTGAPLLRREEEAMARRQAEERAADEAMARRQAEERAAAAEERARSLEEELARLRSERG
jgi:Uma2 family endonuclease